MTENRDEGSLPVCLTCGACCARHRVLLNWTEVDDFAPGGVPVGMTIRLSDHVRIMAGTEGPPGRCIALEGRVGDRVHCTIYPKRGSQCREFNPTLEGGGPNEACDKARLAFGLPPVPAGKSGR